MSPLLDKCFVFLELARRLDAPEGPKSKEDEKEKNTTNAADQRHPLRPSHRWICGRSLATGADVPGDSGLSGGRWKLLSCAS